MRRLAMSKEVQHPGHNPKMSDEDRDLGRLRSQITSMERELSELHRMVHNSNDAKPEGSGQAVKDARWNCEKCSSLLAWYDEAEDLLRIRYKDHLTYVRLGNGGSITIMCRGCAQPNVQEYQTEAQIAESQVQAK